MQVRMEINPATSEVTSFEVLKPGRENADTLNMAESDHDPLATQWETFVSESRKPAHEVFMSGLSSQVSDLMHKVHEHMNTITGGAESQEWQDCWIFSRHLHALADTARTFASRPMPPF